MLNVVNEQILCAQVVLLTPLYIYVCVCVLHKCTCAHWWYIVHVNECICVSIATVAPKSTHKKKSNRHKLSHGNDFYGWRRKLHEMEWIGWSAHCTLTEVHTRTYTYSYIVFTLSEFTPNIHTYTHISRTLSMAYVIVSLSVDNVSIWWNPLKEWLIGQSLATLYDDNDVSLPAKYLMPMKPHTGINVWW